MFEGGVLPRVPADDAVGMSGAPGGDVAPEPVTCPEDVAGLLGSLAAGGALAGVVEGLLARLLVTAQDADDEGATADEDAVPTLFTNESGTDVALVAASEQRRTVGAEEASTSGLIGLGASGLGELAAACRRLATWATWGEALAAACLAGCPELSSHPGQWGPHGEVSPVVGYEERRFNATCLLSTRLGVSRTRAGQMVDHGQALMSMGFAPVEAMERCGVLDSAKASLVTRRLEDVPTLVALAVQDKVLPQAPRRSVSQVGRDLDRALMEIDPDGHAERSQNNTERRCVSRPRPAGEGLCQVRLLLPTMDALLLDATLDAIAASARACGEKRTLGQLRADAITAMTLSTLRTSQQAAYHRPTQAPTTPASTNHDNSSGGGGGTDNDCHGGYSLGGGICGSGSGIGASGGDGICGGGLSEPGSVLSSSIPLESPSPGRLLPDGVPLEGLLGALSGLVGSNSPWWTPSATGHLPLPAGIRINVNVTVPLSSLTDPGGLAQPEDAAAHDPGVLRPGTSVVDNRFQDGDPGGCGPGGSESPDDPLCLEPGGAGPGESPTATLEPLNSADSPSGGRSLPGHNGRNLSEPAPVAPTTQPTAQFVSPLSSTPVEVAEVRIGARSAAVPAMTAWALAAGGTWRRLITDPVSGVVIDVGRTRYRPPAGLADLVRARDRVCVFPTCQTPAERCDIDHLTAWSQGGTTSLDNLVVLCEAHHRLKHTPGWALTRDQASGTLSWHTPDKTVYQRHPDGTITRHPKRVGPHQHLVPSTVIPKDLSKQISPDILNRLNRALDRALDNPAHNHTSLSTNTSRSGRARLVTRGPQPGHKPGAFETTPYPQATHTLQLAPLIDQAPPF
ncbi:HNH endonuclease [Actinomyces oris]|uniref:HNH endonuclease signature motif containing protein n=1 Tax=Actinomyces TaxID=1654 RepID=UPI00094D0611|nr:MULTISPECIES: HNH endonuclease signature motif containing protein [Actinomyces]OLO63781.1 HNH endonuclease [Actinomyces oris]